MTKQHAKVIIVGGGISGLSLADELEKQGEDDYLLFESNTKVGGLCSSWQDLQGEWHDFGPHIFHGRDGFDWFRELLPDCITGVRSDVVVLADGEVTSYPVQCACGDLSEDHKIWKNYAEHCYNEYGESMFWRFFYPYNEKMFGCEIYELDCSIAGRAPRTSDRLQPYLYPKSGRFASLPEAILLRLKPSNIMTGSPVDYVDRNAKYIVSGNTCYHYDKLVWAAPISHLLKALGRRRDVPNKYIDLVLVTTKQVPSLEFLAKYSALTSDEFYRMSAERVIKQNESQFVQYELNLRRCAGTWFDRGEAFVVPQAYVVPTVDWIHRSKKVESDLLEDNIYLHGRAGRGFHMNIWAIVCRGKELVNSLFQ